MTRPTSPAATARKPRPRLEPVGNRYGAPMGRNGYGTEPEPGARFALRRLEWVDGDYDHGGAYWGRTAGESIYWLESTCGTVRLFYRAKDSAHAASMAREEFDAPRFTSNVDAPAVRRAQLLAGHVEGYLRALAEPPAPGSYWARYTPADLREWAADASARAFTIACGQLA